MSSLNTESIQEFYTRVQLDLDALQEAAEEFDNKVALVEPERAKLITKIDQLLSSLSERGNPPFARRVSRCKALIASIEKRYKYDEQQMELLFRSIRLLSEHAPAEIMGKDLLTELKEYFLEEQAAISESPPNKKFLKKSDKFLMLKNGDMQFLLPFNRQISRETMTVNKEKPNKTKQGQKIFILAGDSVGFVEGEKIVLSVEKKSIKFTIAADEIEGVIFIKPELLKAKVQYLDADVKSNPYFILRGKRYYFVGDNF